MLVAERIYLQTVNDRSQLKCNILHNLLHYQY